ncbi:MAG: AraC family transcriptional regulator [Cytophagales bacterium]|nr:AraC family transcriptional regulator [Cytophagales bacterium]
MIQNKSIFLHSLNVPVMYVPVMYVPVMLMKKLDTEQEPTTNTKSYSMMSKQGTEKNSLFIQRITELIEINLHDEQYGISQLCKDFGISRAQLHRNLIARTGLSASKYIRSIRLRKAIDLLLDSDLNISQVAYEVGFNDPKYFSRLFTKEFKQSPRDFRKEQVA